MASKKEPNKGTVEISSETPAQRKARLEKEAKAQAQYLKDFPIPQNHVPSGDEGLRITLRALEGETAPELLPIDFHFQIPPLENFTRQLSFEHQEWMALRLGQFDRPVGYNLQRVTFQTMFLDYDRMFTVLKSRVSAKVLPAAHGADAVAAVPGPVWVPNPRKMTAYLVDIMHSGTAFQLLAYHPPALWGSGAYEVNMKATLRDLQIEERAGEVDARYVDVTFVEHRLPEVQRKSRGMRTPATVTVRYDPKPHIRTKAIVPYATPDQVPLGPLASDEIHWTGEDFRLGPSINWLAKFYYGSSAKWKLIYRANPKLLAGWPTSTPIGRLAMNHRQTVHIHIPAERDTTTEKTVAGSTPNHPTNHH